MPLRVLQRNVHTSNHQQEVLDFARYKFEQRVSIRGFFAVNAFYHSQASQAKVLTGIWLHVAGGTVAGRQGKQNVGNG